MILDVNSMCLYDASGKSTKLSSKIQLDIIKLFITNHNKILDRDKIRKEIWGEVHISSRSVDVHISKIRKMIGHESLQTFPALGYKLVSKISVLSDDTTVSNPTIQMKHKYQWNDNSIIIPLFEYNDTEILCTIVEKNNPKVSIGSYSRDIFNNLKKSK